MSKVSDLDRERVFPIWRPAMKMVLLLYSFENISFIGRWFSIVYGSPWNRKKTGSKSARSTRSNDLATSDRSMYPLIFARDSLDKADEPE